MKICRSGGGVRGGKEEQRGVERTWAATLYSSSSGSCKGLMSGSIPGTVLVNNGRTFVKWNCSGSSVLRLTFKPTLKKSGSGFRSYVRNNALLLSGDMAKPICFR